jgi:hypothetical protein
MKLNQKKLELQFAIGIGKNLKLSEAAIQIFKDIATSLIGKPMDIHYP